MPFDLNDAPESILNALEQLVTEIEDRLNVYVDKPVEQTSFSQIILSLEKSDCCAPCGEGSGVIDEDNSTDVVIDASYDGFMQTMTVSGKVGLFVETSDGNGVIIGSGIIGSEGTVTYPLNTKGQVHNAPIYTKSDLSNIVSHSLVLIPSNEIHFTTLEGYISYEGTSGDEILLSDGTIINVIEYAESFDVPAGKHIVKLVESVDRGNYVSISGEALVELHNFPTLSTVTDFSFYKGESAPSDNLIKVPNCLPSNITNISYMFADASSFNQDLSMWCVTNLPTKPASFNSGASLLVGAKLPVWGTCPVV